LLFFIMADISSSVPRIFFGGGFNKFS
jgi:hypothetical protein